MNASTIFLKLRFSPLKPNISEALVYMVYNRSHSTHLELSLCCSPLQIFGSAQLHQKSLITNKVIFFYIKISAESIIVLIKKYDVAALILYSVDNNIIYVYSTQGRYI